MFIEINGVMEEINRCKGSEFNLMNGWDIVT